ncbi:MAG: hypothetical protein ACFB0B_10690 [Thermonemataceae bacterium]
MSITQLLSISILCVAFQNNSPVILPVVEHKISFTLINNTPQEQSIYTGRSVVVMAKGAAYRFEKKLGTKMYMQKEGTIYRFLFQVNTQMHDKKIYLRDYL